MFALLLVMMALYSLQSLFCRLYTAARGGSGAIQFSVFYSAFAGVCTLAVNGFSYQPSAVTVVLGLMNAIMLLIYNIAMVKCGNRGSYAFMMICVLSGGILVPMAYDVLYLHCSFSTMQSVAVAMMLVSFVVMNLDGVRARKKRAVSALVCDAVCRQRAVQRVDELAADADAFYAAQRDDHHHVPGHGCAHGRV